jgi:rare lipoprotein A
MYNEISDERYFSKRLNHKYMKTAFITIHLLLLSLLLTSFEAKNITASDAYSQSRTGVASYYNDRHQGKKTASGELYQNTKFTAAHRTLPFGTEVKVTNLANGKSVTVHINDRGPYAKGRLIDLSKIAAKEIGLIKMGVAKVKIEYNDQQAAANK